MTVPETAGLQGPRVTIYGEVLSIKGILGMCFFSAESEIPDAS